MIDHLQEFREAMHRAGLAAPDRIEVDGGLHRFFVEGDRRGTCNGWYCLHTDGRAAGIFGSWKTGSRSTWAANGKRLNDAEREAFASQVRRLRLPATHWRARPSSMAKSTSLRYESPKPKRATGWTFARTDGGPFSSRQLAGRSSTGRPSGSSAIRPCAHWSRRQPAATSICCGDW